MKSTDENLQIWEQRIRERIQGGMTIEEWCKKNKVSKHQYNYWNHRVRALLGKTGEEVTFADITPVLAEVDTTRHNPVTSDFQIFSKSFQVSVPGKFNPSSLAELMKVLQEL